MHTKLAFDRKLMVIIACEVLMDELVHILREDGDLQSIFLPQRLKDSKMHRKLCDVGLGNRLKYVGTELPCREDLSTGYSVAIQLGPMSHHTNPDALQDDVQSRITAADDIADSILLLYGLCGNALLNVDAYAQEVKAPVTIVRDRNGKIADDCIGMLIGERQSYLDLLRRCHGTFFMSPTWIENWRRFMSDIQLIHDVNDLEGAKEVFHYMGYERVVMLDSDLQHVSGFESMAREFADKFGFRLEHLSCHTTMLESAYQQAKGYLANGHPKEWTPPPEPTPLE
jgi:hypothetical protein